MSNKWPGAGQLFAGTKEGKVLVDGDEDSAMLVSLVPLSRAEKVEWAQIESGRKENSRQDFMTTHGQGQRRKMSLIS